MIVAAGFGFRQSATAESLRTAMNLACEQAAIDTIDVFAVPQDKAGAPAIQALAEQQTTLLSAIAPQHLRAQPTSTQSPASTAIRGTGSVAEAAALAAVGQGRLLTTRQISPDRLATCALAIGTRP